MKDRILVVDDERDIVNLVSYHLGRSGLEVIPAYSGTEALERAAEVKPDLLILDIMMPEPDGFEVCRMLRQKGDAALRDIPIVMLTARSDVEDKIRGLSIGADDYVSKPFNLKELTLRVENLLSKRRVRKGFENKVISLEEKLYRPVDIKTLNTYSHCLDGRLRIRVPGIKNSPERALEIERQMASVKGVVKIDISSVTGSILIYFDPAMTNTDSIVRSLNSIGIFNDADLHSKYRKENGESIGTAVGKTVIQSVIERLLLAAI